MVAMSTAINAAPSALSPIQYAVANVQQAAAPQAITQEAPPQLPLYLPPLTYPPPDLSLADLSGSTPSQLPLLDVYA